MNTTGVIAKNTSFQLIASVAELGLTFFIGIILTRSLGPEQYGIYAYIIWVFSLIAVIINFGLGEMIRRFVPEALGRQEFHKPAGLIRLALIIRIVIAITTACIIVFASSFWARLTGYEDNQVLFVFVGLCVLPDGIYLLLVNVCKGFQKFDFILYLSLVLYISRTVVIIVLMSLGYGVTEVILAYVCTSVFSVIIGVFFLRRLVPLNTLMKPVPLSGDAGKSALKYAITAAGIMFISYFVIERVEVFLIGLYCSIEDVGFYNLAFRFSRFAGILPQAIAFAIFPYIANQFGKGAMEKIKKIFFISTRYLMIFTLPVAIVMITLADSIIIFLYGDDYIPAATILQILSIPFAFFSISRAADMVIRGINRPGFILKTLIIFAILKVGLSLWLIPKYGIIGAAIVSGLPLILYIPIYSYFLSEKIGASWPIRDTIKIFVASCIMGLAVYGLNYMSGEILSIFLGIPLAIVIYVITIFAFRVINEEDIVVLREMKDSVPLTIRKYYSSLIVLLERVVIKK